MTAKTKLPDLGKAGLAGWGHVLLSWVVPGLGFFLMGRRARGLAHFFLIVVTFLIGLGLHGGVAWPAWTPARPDFNLMNNFTFLVQIGSGLPGLASLLGGLAGLQWLGGLPEHPYYELGGVFSDHGWSIELFCVMQFLRPDGQGQPPL